MPSVLNLSCKPIPLVRIALIGIGSRGMKTLERYAYIKGAEIRYIADLSPERLELANQKLEKSGRHRAHTLQGEDAWIQACKKDDIDLIYICTEWKSHATIAIEAMKRGKHVAVEVPAATTINECYELVRTAEATQRHLFMTENCCYDYFALETLEMHKQGLFGEITHCEGAYIHNLSQAVAANCPHNDTHSNWMTHSCATHGGNPYPTHGIGPIAQLLGFHRGDRMERLVSITSRGSKANGEDPIGRINTALIQTHREVSILLQLDVTTPRPYSRIQTICGTKAYAQKYPITTLQLDNTHTLTGSEAEKKLKEYATSDAARLWIEGHQMGVANEMNYAMDARLIQCLQKGLPLDIDAYDAAEWPSLAELTRISAEQGGRIVEIPHFI